MAQSSEATYLLVVDAGQHDRENCLVHAALQAPVANSAFAAAPISVRLVELEGNGAPYREVPAQLDEQGNLTWLLAGHTAAGQQRRYLADLSSPGLAGSQIEIATRTDHLVLSAAGELMARYVFLGTWKPHFYPVIGPHGSVVRGASGEHQHQTGLFLGYGGHGEGGSTNIWSDWDEPPYGPCGKMLHQAFERLRGGPVYGHIVERVAYIKPTGDKILDELRDMRIYPLPGGEKIIDITIRVPPPDDPGACPFILAARVADTMRIRDHSKPRLPDGTFPLLDPPGEIENSERQRGEEEANGKHASWCDYAGKVGEGWSGIALFDHPANYEFPGRFHAGAYGCMSVSHHYPPEVPPVGQVSWTVRVYVHAGGVVASKVANKYQDFVEPPKVTVTPGA
jgi:hypothetical protein